LKIKPEDAKELLFKTLGVVGKVVYAFLYQEHYLSIPFFKKKEVIEWGGVIMPLFNRLMKALTEFPETDLAVTESTDDMYPGHYLCRLTQGHSIWHE